MKPFWFLHTPRNPLSLFRVCDDVDVRLMVLDWWFLIDGSWCHDDLNLGVLFEWERLRVEREIRIELESWAAWWKLPLNVRPLSFCPWCIFSLLEPLFFADLYPVKTWSLHVQWVLVALAFAVGCYVAELPFTKVLSFFWWCDAVLSLVEMSRCWNVLQVLVQVALVYFAVGRSLVRAFDFVLGLPFGLEIGMKNVYRTLASLLARSFCF